MLRPDMIMPQSLGQSVYFKGSLGDSICLLPVIEALSMRLKAKVLVSGEYFDELLSNNPYADVSSSINSPIIFRHQDANESGEHLIDFFARLANIEVIDRQPHLYLRSCDVFESAVLPPSDFNERPKVAIDPQAGWPNREWGHDKYEELVRELTKQGYLVFQVGKPFSNCFGEYVDLHLAGADSRFYGTLSIRQTADLLRLCDCFVGNDSGLAHLAATVQTPSVVLFGPVHPIFRCHAWSLPVFHNVCPAWRKPHTACPNMGRCLRHVQVSEILRLVRFSLENRIMVPKASRRIIGMLSGQLGTTRTMPSI